LPPEPARDWRRSGNCETAPGEQHVFPHQVFRGGWIKRQAASHTQQSRQVPHDNPLEFLLLRGRVGSFYADLVALFLQLVQLRQHFFAMRIGIDFQVHLLNGALGIDQERVARRHGHGAEVAERAVLGDHHVIGIR